MREEVGSEESDPHPTFREQTAELQSNDDLLRFEASG